MHPHTSDTQPNDSFPNNLRGLAGALAQIDHQSVGVICILFIMGGMVASEVMMSMGMIFLAASAVFNLNFRQNMLHFFRHRALLALTLIFAVYFVSGLWSENTVWWLDRVRMKLPFLLMPMAIVSIPRMDRAVYLKLLYTFFIWISLASLHSLALYLADYEAINSAYSEGRVLPTPVQHIRFSLMAAFCVAIGAYLLRERFVWKYAWERRLIQALTLFLIVYLHILAVRSGLLALYAMMLYYAALLVLERRKYLLAGGLAAAMVLAGLLAYQYVPSFQNRINYSLYTLRMFEKQEQISELSDARRIGSLVCCGRHDETPSAHGSGRRRCARCYRCIFAAALSLVGRFATHAAQSVFARRRLGRYSGYAGIYFGLIVAAVVPAGLARSALCGFLCAHFVLLHGGTYAGDATRHSILHLVCFAGIAVFGRAECTPAEECGVEAVSQLRQASSCKPQSASCKLQDRVLEISFFENDDRRP
jgi:hypothetical protein